MPSSFPDEGRDVTRGSLRRSAKLLSLPLGHAGRAAVGLGRRAAGVDSATVSAEVAQASAQQLFAVLGELKGGAMKVGQVLSLLEAALPEEQAAPYREQLRRLQASAPPMPTARVAAVMANDFGPQWRAQFSEFSLRPAAAASIGQVHRGVWRATGQPVAIKIQYPGAEAALTGDLALLDRIASLIQPLAGGMDVKSVTAEVVARMAEEVDYEREAAQQEQAARRFDGDPEIVVPHVLAHSASVIVSEWMEGEPLLSAEASPAERRDTLGFRYAHFLFRCAETCGLLHGDPHPGNFLIAPDGRLVVLDWGLAEAMDALPEAMGRLLRLAALGDAEQMTAGLRAEGFVTRDVDAEALHAYLRPFVEPATAPEFHFTRAWMREQMQRIGADKTGSQVITALNLPASYMMVHRVWLGGVSVLSQLDCRAPFAGIVGRYLPGWEEPTA